MWHDPRPTMVRHEAKRATEADGGRRERHASVKLSGRIWSLSNDERRETVANVCASLARRYGAPRHGNPTDPVDDLVFIILSNKTSPASAVAAFDALRTRFGSWTAVASGRLPTIR